MAGNNYFQFKQFKIIQEKAAMKVGTDGALLGAWVNVENVENILDIGTGTGLIALMLAQRSPAKALGIEIEKSAAEEASKNVNNSRWNDRVSVQNISFQDFVKTTDQRFDLIVSNPPFFSGGSKNEIQNKAIARHNHLLPFSVLISGAVKLLRQKGRLAVVLPTVPAEEFIDLGISKGLFLNRITRVKPKATKQCNRFLIECSKEKTSIVEDELIIYSNDSSDFTEMYKEITREFYLKF